MKTRMGRPRTTNKDLPPGLYHYPGRNFYIRIGDMKPVDLRTKDRSEALAIYWEFRKEWDIAQKLQAANAVATNLQIAIAGDDRLTVAGYSDRFRAQHLPSLKKRNGKSLGDKTRNDYARMLERQVETYAPFKELALVDAQPKDVRQFLARWIDSPHFYNYVKSVLSRVFQHALDEGMIDRSPMENVRRRPVARRNVVLSMDDYLLITAQMTEHQRRACDLLYLVSHNPVDVLALEDRAPDITYATRRGIECVVLSFCRSKTEQAVEIVDHVDRRGGIEETLEWFRKWKKDESIASNHLVVYPKTLQRRHIGNPVSPEWLSRAFSAAVIEAGFKKGTYELRDLRKTGLTNEAKARGGKASRKGGHATQEMREYYVVGLVQRSNSNLSVLRKPKTA